MVIVMTVMVWWYDGGGGGDDDDDDDANSDESSQTEAISNLTYTQQFLCYPSFYISFFCVSTVFHTRD